MRNLNNMQIIYIKNIQYMIHINIIIIFIQLYENILKTDVKINIMLLKIYKFYYTVSYFIR